jgi:endonuclease IV
VIARVFESPMQNRGIARLSRAMLTILSQASRLADRKRTSITSHASYLLNAGVKPHQTNQEEVMRFATQAALAAVMCIAVGATAGSASAQDNVTSCVQAAKQVTAALATATQGNVDAARQEKKIGQQYCLTGMYHEGMHHYDRAMELLTAKN